MSRCKGCGRTVVWGKTPEGKRVSLDMSPPVYEFRIAGTDTFLYRREDCAVSHFEMCKAEEPKVNQEGG